MSLGWTADGIAKALDCGGVLLERYRRPGFTGGRAVRRSDPQGGPGAGIPVEHEWPADEPDPTSSEWRRRRGTS
ncbi:MAG: hypothetical protein AABM43_12105 [Actinomycetota bacterium]